MLIENYLPGVRDNGGISTNEPVSFGTTATFTGNVTFSGTRSGGSMNLINVNIANGTSPTLTAAQSTSLIYMNSSSGSLVTLPSPSVGLTYSFVVGPLTLVSAATYAVITSGGAFLNGTIVTLSPKDGVSAGTVNTFIGNGTSHIALRMNGTNAGGSAGTFFRTVCTTATTWTVMEGVSLTTGTQVTPFSTV